ncbi:hypothetical protein HK100_012934 [Physocladia obscura]|uniref:Uncharacterized protein n=1 Tax=Physocladia obscura TaxID=109957 RepID=A0AAD5XCU6_9FUNG|nr:hypothetical protein HK100_012934 [Physocladia obscura]
MRIYKTPENVREEEVSFNSADGWTLKGTLCYPITPKPESGFPIIAIAQGTGRSDRDGNKLPKFVSEIYSRQAHFFASIGVASIRWDKRATNASNVAPPGYSGEKDLWMSVGVEELIWDIVAAIKYSISLPSIDSASVLISGHSESSIFMGKIYEASQKADIPIKASIMLCGFGENGLSAIKKQEAKEVHDLESGTLLDHYFKLPLMKAVNLWVDDVKELCEDPKLAHKDTHKHLGLIPISLKWFRGHFNIDLVEDYKFVNSPALIIGGGKDIQIDSSLCTEENAKKFLVNCPHVEVAVIPNMTHMLRDSDHAEFSSKTYMKVMLEEMKKPLSPELLRVISEFVQSL